MSELCHAPPHGTGDETGAPQTGEGRAPDPRPPDARVDRPAQEQELEPARDACRRGESRGSGPRLEAERAGQRKGEEIAEPCRQHHAREGELERSSRVAQRVEGGRVESPQGARDEPDG